MTISIIIPAYNVEAYLEDTLQSVLQQTYTDIEVILVDDGSTDRTGGICDEYALQDKRIRVIHKENGGLSDARNAGIKIATGEYIHFLDGDDMYLSANAIERLITLLCTQSKKPDLLLFRCTDIYNQSKILRPEYDEDWISAHSGEEVFFYLIQHDKFQMSACFLWARRELILQHKLYFETGLLSEDVDWSLRLWKHTHYVLASNLPIYGYLHRQGSITTTYSIRHLRSFDHIFSTWYKRYQATTEQNSYYWRGVTAYLAQQYTSCLYNWMQIEQKDKKETLRILEQHSHLLAFSNSTKSNRPKWVKQHWGTIATIYLFGWYGIIKRALKK